MPNWMQAAVVVETALFSFLLSLGLTAMALQGLFHMMPGSGKEVIPVPSMAGAVQAGNRGSGIQRA